jgi:hypothetical protein
MKGRCNGTKKESKKGKDNAPFKAPLEARGNQGKETQRALRLAEKRKA